MGGLHDEHCILSEAGCQAVFEDFHRYFWLTTRKLLTTHDRTYKVHDMMKGGKDGRLTLRGVPKSHVRWLNKRAMHEQRVCLLLGFPKRITASEIIRGMIRAEYQKEKSNASLQSVSR